MWDDHLGYIVSDPIYLGTALDVRVRVKLHHLSTVRISNPAWFASVLVAYGSLIRLEELWGLDIWPLVWTIWHMVRLAIWRSWLQVLLWQLAGSAFLCSQQFSSYFMFNCQTADNRLSPTIRDLKNINIPLRSLLWLVNLCNRSGEERRRQILCDKRDNNFVWNQISLNFTSLWTDLSVKDQKTLIYVKWRSRHI